MRNLILILSLLAVNTAIADGPKLHIRKINCEKEVADPSFLINETRVYFVTLNTENTICEANKRYCRFIVPTDIQELIPRGFNFDIELSSPTYIEVKDLFVRFRLMVSRSGGGRYSANTVEFSYPNMAPVSPEEYYSLNSSENLNSGVYKLPVGLRREYRGNECRFESL